MRSDSDWEHEVEKELEQYHKSVASSPVFCKNMFTRSTMISVERSLPNIQRELHYERMHDDVRAETLLRNEILEAAYELGRGNYMSCVKEFREAVAILNRMIDAVKDMAEFKRKTQWTKKK